MIELIILLGPFTSHHYKVFCKGKYKIQPITDLSSVEAMFEAMFVSSSLENGAVEQLIGFYGCLDDET